MKRRPVAYPVVLLVFFLAILALFASACGGRKTPTSRIPAPPPSTSAPSTPAPPPKSPGGGSFPAPPPGTPLPLIGEGLASWYGVPYHGRRSSNGEVYDMHKMTAAHRTLPFDTVVRVTNLKNQKYADVRITDRGPFVEGRVVDLSLAAARAIDMVAEGLARVKIERISGPVVTGAFTVQVGAFQQLDNAYRMRKQLETRYQPVFVFEYDSPKGKFYRVRVGRVPSEEAAQRLARKLEEQDNLNATFVVRLDDDE